MNLEKNDDASERPLDLIVGRRFVCVSLGDMYADECAVCGVHSYWGLATAHGPQGCVEAVKAGRVYCDAHLPKPYGRYEPPNKIYTPLVG